jgi:hypothetical protein
MVVGASSFVDIIISAWLLKLNSKGASVISTINNISKFFWSIAAIAIAIVLSVFVWGECVSI